jgi:signal transduction histidine kinase
MTQIFADCRNPNCAVLWPRMSKGAKRETTDLRLLLKFIQELSDAEVIEQVYAAALNVVQDAFTPDRVFVALSGSGSPKPRAPDGHSVQPGWHSEIVVPIYAGQHLMGRLVLQYDQPHAFSDHNAVLVEIIAAQAALSIEHIRERCNKDELVAIAAHELRTPLTAILGATYLLRAGRDDERFRSLEIIERNARAQVTLIEELLNVCQLDAGRLELQMTTLDLVSILEKVIEEIQSTAAAVNTALHVDFQRPLMVRGDPQRLGQIFSNLLTNSVRFASPDGEIRITTEAGSAVTRICIRDNGIGIVEEQLPHIFERFYQAPVRRPKSYGGWGLGLAIVKDLVTMHGGTITAESDGAGKGACFTVTLPAS